MILVFICKNFEDVVKAFRLEARPTPEMDYMFVQGLLLPAGSDACTMLPASFEEYISENGFTVTLYLRLSDGYGYVPIGDPSDRAVADYVNSVAMENWSEKNS